jgi:hypothetical protein
MLTIAKLYLSSVNKNNCSIIFMFLYNSRMVLQLVQSLRWQSNFLIHCDLTDDGHWFLTQCHCSGTCLGQKIHSAVLHIVQDGFNMIAHILNGTSIGGVIYSFFIIGYTNYFKLSYSNHFILVKLVQMGMDSDIHLPRGPRTALEQTKPLSFSLRHIGNLFYRKLIYFHCFIVTLKY